MKIQCLVLGQLEVNCYLLTEGAEAVIIDPGAECERILKSLKQNQCELKKILLTHGHFDHTGAVKELKEKTGAEVCIHSKDSEMLINNSKNLSFLTGEKIQTCKADILLDDIEEISVGEAKIRIFHTPGHNEGSVSFLCGANLFSGDLLFQGSIGRFDFGDFKTEMNSIKLLMDTFDDKVKVFPGHGISTTIGIERRYNPYIVNMRN